MEMKHKRIKMAKYFVEQPMTVPVVYQFHLFHLHIMYILLQCSYFNVKLLVFQDDFFCFREELCWSVCGNTKLK